MTYAITIVLLLAIIASWVWLRHMARQYSLAHPEFGEHREEGRGCGGCPEGGCAGRCNE